MSCCCAAQGKPPRSAGHKPGKKPDDASPQLEVSVAFPRITSTGKFAPQSSATGDVTVFEQGIRIRVGTGGLGTGPMLCYRDCRIFDEASEQMVWQEGDWRDTTSLNFRFVDEASRREFLALVLPRLPQHIPSVAAMLAALQSDAPAEK